MGGHSLAPNPVRQAGACVFGDHHGGLGSLVPFDLSRSVLIWGGPMLCGRHPPRPFQIGSQSLVSIGINEPNTSHIGQSCYNRSSLDQSVGVHRYWHPVEVSSADHFYVFTIIFATIPIEVINARMSPCL